MLELRQDANGLSLRGNEYELAFPAGNAQHAFLRVRGVAAATLRIAGACDADGQADEVEVRDERGIEQDGKRLTVIAQAVSRLWGPVSYVFQCYPDRIEHFARRHGARYLDDLNFFGERSQARLSEPGWPQVFNPEPNARRKHYFDANEFATIGVSSDRSYYRGNWLFTPGPLCYALALPGNGWLAAGVAAKAESLNFDHFKYDGSPHGFSLSLRYGGHTRTEGDWESPHLVLVAADDEYSALDSYCHYLRKAGLAPSKASPQFEWWKEPIFCGWGEQVTLEGRESVANLPAITAADLCTQANYERFLKTLYEQGIVPGTIVIDDKWQRQYGLNDVDQTKWPDMAGFVRRQHAAGRKVLLWLKAWSAEGVPVEECIVDGEGRPLAVDPSSERFEARLREQVRTMAGDLDADGFKIDFTHCLPTERNARSASGMWGIALLRRLLGIIHDEAKATKTDALIMAHTANPCFADVVDMLRLNDIANVVGEPDYVESMLQRARVARLTSAHWLIDTDNWPSPNRSTWIDYCRLQPDLGVPSLYYVSRVYHLSEDDKVTDEALQPSDYAEVAELWATYRGKKAR